MAPTRIHVSRPDDAAVAAAVEQLGSAVTSHQLAGAAAALAKGLGMERYALLDVHGAAVPGLQALHHNAPPEVAQVLASSDGLARDAVIARVWATPIPVVWPSRECPNGPWQDQYGDAGYRAGVAASSRSPSGESCVVVFSRAGGPIADEDVVSLMAYVALSAATAAGTLKRVRDELLPRLTPRELECLLHVLAGHSAKQTSRAIGVGASTVNQYLERARSKLQSASSFAAAMTAMRLGLISQAEAMQLAASAASARQA